MRLALLGTVLFGIVLGLNHQWVDAFFEQFLQRPSRELITQRVEVGDRITIVPGECTNARFERRGRDSRETLNILGNEGDRCVVAVRHTDGQDRYQTWVCRLVAHPVPHRLDVSRGGVDFVAAPEADQRRMWFRSDQWWRGWGSCTLVEAGSVSWIRT